MTLTILSEILIPQLYHFRHKYFLKSRRFFLFIVKCLLALCGNLKNVSCLLITKLITLKYQSKVSD
jgi:hypothetical protein